MTPAAPNVPTDRLGRLPDTMAASFLSRAVVEEDAPVPAERLRQGISYWFPDERRWTTGELDSLLEESADRIRTGGSPASLDQWLAPRLHSTLRLTRAEATDNQLWNYIGLVMGAELIRLRWGRPAGGRRIVGQAARFAGRWDIQYFSRLWWAAELFRNGDDYEPVVTACANQDVLHTALRLDLVNHRPTAQALLRLLQKEVVRTGRDINGLVKAAGSAASTIVYEVVAPDQPRDHEAQAAWIASQTDVYWQPNRLPQGPFDGRVDEKSVARLVAQFEELFRTAPVRDKKDVREETTNV
ncbi:hypothetical protein K7B10_25175 [Streptomyces flavotricini]|uniref:Uncharacterized protein n=1 Tax=Streptomyces flavotricini TaxID=66888 RepID=A0ABS8EAS5_9ACTN|nr:DUF6339 family protein [Streptomyces flavotricini]MCC0098008.1 hypothetical protein [Streptomyces flavotricini]